ncbi:MAG: PAS domain S-box protein [Phycisphaerales bacterium]|nr:MAG: PAS domain S-box protein [Phycisphaerales bacterium]
MLEDRCLWIDGKIESEPMHDTSHNPSAVPGEADSKWEGAREAGLPRIELAWDDRGVESVLGEGCDAGRLLEPLARLTARLLGSPIAAVTLADQERIWIVSGHGLDVRSVDRSDSFCGRCVELRRPLVVEDAASDPAFACLGLVRGGVGHYAGFPLMLRSGEAVGTVCVLGPGKRVFSDDEIETLGLFARTAMDLLEQHRLLGAHQTQRQVCVGVFDASMDGIHVFDAVRDAAGEITDFVFTMINGCAERLLGTPAGTLIGARLSERFPGVCTNGLLDAYRRVATTGKPHVDEVYYKGEDLRGWFEVSTIRVGEGIAVTFRNIDRRKEREASLALTNDRFRMLSAATEDIIWDHDIRAGHVWWSENLEVVLGYSPEEVEPTVAWWASLIHPEERDRVVGSFDRAVDGDAKNWSAEYRMRRADGGYAQMLDRAFIIRDESGEAIRAVGAEIDLTARLRAQAEIAFQNSLLEAQAEASQDGILVTDAGHNCVRANRVFRELSGVSDDQLSARDAVRSIFAEAANADAVDRAVLRTFEDPCSTLKKEISFRDGRAIELRSEALLGSEQAFLGRVWFLRDLTHERRNNELLRAHNLVVEASNVVLFRWRPEPGWPVELVSRNVEQFGYTAEELLARERLFADMVHPDDHARVGGEVMAYLAEGREMFEQEYRILCADGSDRWVYDRTVVDRNAAGELESLQGVLVDITERRRFEQELADSAAMLKELTSQIPGAVYRYRLRPDGRAEFPYISDGVTALCGVTPEQLAEDSSLLMAGLVPEDFEPVQASILESAETMRPWTCEFRLLRSDGTIRWIGGNSIPRAEPDGSVLWHGLITDITAQKATEATLRRVTQLLERTNTLARVGGWELDLATGGVFMSGEVKRIFGLDDHAELDLEATLSFYEPESRAMLRTHIERAVEERAAYDLELRLLTASGEVHWVRAQGEPVVAEGRVVKLRGALHDIDEQYHNRLELARRASELERLRDAAEAASRSKSEFIANMSHEIRTPLTAILGFAELLRDGDGLLDKAQERANALDTIAAAGQHLLTVINDILDISKIEAGRMQIEAQATDLPELLREVMRLMSVRAVSKGIGLSATLRTAIPREIRVDPTRFRQIALNLIGNAVKFTEIGGVGVEIGLEGEAPRARLVVDITDTGPGITEAQRGQLFTMFSQADTSQRRRHGGTGLGLVISRRCAELMGGCVTLVRSEVGVGSCFRVELPIEIPEGAARVTTLDAPPASPRSSESDPVTISGRILLAEDGPDNQRLIVFHLQRAGATVDVAENGRIALEMLRAGVARGEAYDLLLTDVQMPEMDGLELAQHVRAEGSAIPIVAITAHAMAEDRERCLRAGCNDYTSKPIDRAKLIRVCEAWIRASRGERGLGRDAA